MTVIESNLHLVEQAALLAKDAGDDEAKVLEIFFASIPRTIDEDEKREIVGFLAGKLKLSHRGINRRLESLRVVRSPRQIREQQLWDSMDWPHAVRR